MENSRNQTPEFSNFVPANNEFDLKSAIPIVEEHLKIGKCNGRVYLDIVTHFPEINKKSLAIFQKVFEKNPEALKSLNLLGSLKTRATNLIQLIREVDFKKAEPTIWKMALQAKTALCVLLSTSTIFSFSIITDIPLETSSAASLSAFITSTLLAVPLMKKKEQETTQEHLIKEYDGIYRERDELMSFVSKSDNHQAILNYIHQELRAQSSPSTQMSQDLRRAKKEFETVLYYFENLKPKTA